MGSRKAPPRSFNTVKHSNREERKKRRQKERIAVLSIALTVLAILLTLAVFLVCTIVDAVNDGNPSETGGNPNPSTPPSQAIVFEQKTETNDKIHTGELTVVNEDHAYIFPTSSTHLISIYDNRTKVNGSNPYQLNTLFAKQMHKDAFAQMEKMMLKYYEVYQDGSVMIKYAYRSYADQEALGSTIGAGYSDHHTGYAMALHQGNVNGNPPLNTDHWIYENCHKYGFIVRYPDNKTDKTKVDDYGHCFRYVGIPHAAYITQNGLCLEEYVELLKAYTSENRLKITLEDGSAYEVYYTAATSTASDGVTTLQVPKNYAYTVSGDNIGGFIVTVDLSQPKVA